MSRQNSVLAPSRSRKSARRVSRAAVRQALFESLETRTLLSSTIWTDATVPTLASANDTNSIEVGVKFRSDIAGYITGVRFYKGATNTGTHLGSLWTTSGTLLGQTTFVSESASGWQQATFASPIAIAANTTYVASYFAPAGNYAADLNYFLAAGADSPPLHALQDGVDGGNGLFAYSAGSTFPGTTFNSANYWVDVVFDTNVTLSVTSSSPANGATSVSPLANPSVTFNLDMNPATINSSTVQLRNSSNVAIAAAVTYDAATHTANIAPASSLTLNSSYTIFVVGGASGVKSTGNSALASNFTSTFKVAASVPSSIWNEIPTPAIVDANDANPIEVGVRFRSDVDGVITGIRFYKATANGGTHIGNLWTSTGTLLGSVTFTGESASGWQEATFATPIAITANTTYIASYFAPLGHYSADLGYFAVSGADNAPLHALQDGVDGGNGMFGYSPSSTFPTLTFGSNNYWVDPVFVQPSFTNTAPVAQNKSASLTEDGTANLTLGGTDQETPTSQLTFKILSLPTKGVLKVGGVKVVVGQTFVGPPAGLTYEPGVNTEGGTGDSFKYMVTDPLGLASAAATYSLSITNAVDKGVVTFSGGILRIGGTSKDDTIVVTQNILGKLQVKIGGKLISGTVDAVSVSEIHIWGRSGNDTITLTGITNNAVVVGGSGDDKITGGEGNDMLLGSSGIDTLIGNGGDDLLVGSNQANTLSGGAGNDILVGGGINATVSLGDLRAMLTSWSASLTVTAADNSAARSTFNSGNKGDKLTGGGGINWLMIGPSDSILDRKLTDFVTTLS